MQFLSMVMVAQGLMHSPQDLVVVSLNSILSLLVRKRLKELLKRYQNGPFYFKIRIRPVDLGTPAIGFCLFIIQR